MGKTKNWIVTDTFEHVMVREDANRITTKTHFASQLASAFEAEGFIKASSNTIKFTTISANTTLTALNIGVFVDCSGGSVSLGLPAAALMWNAVTSESSVFYIKRKDSSGNQCTITPDGSETIDTGSSLVLSGVNLPFAILVTDGSNYFTIG